VILIVVARFSRNQICRLTRTCWATSDIPQDSAINRPFNYGNIIDFVSLSYAIPGGRSTAGVGDLICVNKYDCARAFGLFGSREKAEGLRNICLGGDSDMDLGLDVYVPIYDSVLVNNRGRSNLEH